VGTHTQADAVTRVYRLLQDVGATAASQLLVDEQIEDFVADAERRYSADRPLRRVEDVQVGSDGTAPLPTGWVEAFSTLDEIEYPIGDSPRSALDARSWERLLIPVTGDDGATEEERIVFDSDGPVEGESLRIRYTALRAIADGNVPDGDFGALCLLAASMCADTIAAKFASTSAPVLGADTVNYQSKSQEWRSMADRLFRRYLDSMGLRDLAGGGASGASGGSSAAPAGSRVNWDVRGTYGMDLTHPRRIR